MMQQQSSIKYTSAATVWGIFTLYGLFRPISELKKHSNFFLPGGDKLIHLILFAVLTYLVVKAIKERKYQLRPWLTFSAISIFALMTEIVQHFIAYRTGDVLDFIADVVGVCLGLLIFKSK